MIATGLDRLLADPRALRRPALRPARARRLGDRATALPAHLALAAAGVAAGAPVRPRARLLRRRAGHGRRRATQRRSVDRGRRSSRSTATTKGRCGRRAARLRRARPAARRPPGHRHALLHLRGDGGLGGGSGAAPAGVEVWILDRPNPLGGEVVEGNLRRPGFESFVGAFRDAGAPRPDARRDRPARGRARRRWSDGRASSRSSGWRRGDALARARPALDRAVAQHADVRRPRCVYPGLCLIEATELSEGRGTTRPFRLVGAPGVDPPALAARARAARRASASRGVPTYFRPQFQKHRGEVCGGVELVVVDAASASPASALGVEMLLAPDRRGARGVRAGARRPTSSSPTGRRSTCSPAAPRCARRSTPARGRPRRLGRLVARPTRQAFRDERREILLYPGRRGMKTPALLAVDDRRGGVRARCSRPRGQRGVRVGWLDLAAAAEPPAAARQPPRRSARFAPSRSAAAALVAVKPHRRARRCCATCCASTSSVAPIGAGAAARGLAAARARGGRLPRRLSATRRATLAPPRPCSPSCAPALPRPEARRHEPPRADPLLPARPGLRARGDRGATMLRPVVAHRCAGVPGRSGERIAELLPPVFRTTRDVPRWRPRSSTALMEAALMSLRRARRAAPDQRRLLRALARDRPRARPRRPTRSPRRGARPVDPGPAARGAAPQALRGGDRGPQRDLDRRADAARRARARGARGERRPAPRRRRVVARRRAGRDRRLGARPRLRRRAEGPRGAARARRVFTFSERAEARAGAIRTAASTATCCAIATSIARAARSRRRRCRSAGRSSSSSSASRRRDGGALGAARARSQRHDRGLGRGARTSVRLASGVPLADRRLPRPPVGRRGARARARRCGGAASRSAAATASGKPDDVPHRPHGRSPTTRPRGAAGRCSERRSQHDSHPDRRLRSKSRASPSCAPPAPR